MISVQVSIHLKYLVFIISQIIINPEIAVVNYEPDETIKAQKLVPLINETVPFYLEKLESLAKENNGYFALGKVSIKLRYKFIYS